MFRTFNIPISWGELFKRTAKEFSADNCLGLAAQLAYYLLLALVPAIVFLVALTSFLPGDVIQQTLNAAAAVMPQDVLTVVREQMRSIASGQDAGLLTFGFAMALWSSSAAIVAVTDALNRAYDIEEARPWWKVRLTAILLTVGLAAFLLVALGLIMVGPTLAEWLATHAGLGATFEWTWKILQWPLVFALLATAIAVLNYYAPDAEQDWTWVSPGAVLATMLWLVASLAFKFYLTNFGNYNETYGSLGGVIVLMLWFYIAFLLRSTPTVGAARCHQEYRCPRKRRHRILLSSIPVSRDPNQTIRRGPSLRRGLTPNLLRVPITARTAIAASAV